MCHTWVHPAGLGVTCIADTEYPMRVAYSLINEMLQAFAQTYPNGEYTRYSQDANLAFQAGQQLFDQFQDPEKADKITKIEKELDVIKGTVIQSMDEILMNKSKDLSDTSRQFYKTAKKQNQCCTMY